MQVSNKRTYHLIGSIENDNIRKLSEWFRERLDEDPESAMALLLTSGGGVGVLGFGIIDFLMEVKKARLQTTAIGETSSMAIPIFMCGEERIVTPRTTFVIHEGARSFDQSMRWNTSRLRYIVGNMEKSDRMYADFVASRTNGKINTEQILELMRSDTTLYAEDILRLGLAHRIAGQ